VAAAVVADMVAAVRATNICNGFSKTPHASATGFFFIPTPSILSARETMRRLLALVGGLEGVKKGCSKTLRSVSGRL
jgi:hypothetical protein